MTIKLNNVRLSYEHIFTPSAFDDSQEAKYSATLIIPKEHAELPKLKKAFLDAGAEKFPTLFSGASAWPKGVTCALKDADKDTTQSGEILSEKNPEYKNSYILQANSTRRPGVYDRDKTPLVEADGKPYSGCYINVLLGIAGYEFGKVKKGVKAYLNGVQFVADGERFGSDAVDAFDALDGDTNDDFFN
jgi:hypothetical protein